MKTFALTGIATAAVVAIGYLAAANADPKQQGSLSTTEALQRRTVPEAIELSGRLRRPVKWTPQLELVPTGQIQRFDLRGNLLEGLKDGTPIYVKGVVRSTLHRGGTADNPSPFPSQWTVWLEVTDLKVLNDPLDVLK